jgi:hypothetical protein
MRTIIGYKNTYATIAINGFETAKGSLQLGLV